MNVVEHHFGVEALGMFGHALHQVRPLQTVDVAGPVVDIGRRHQLTTLGETGDHGGLQVGSGCIDRRRVAGRSGAEDDQSRVLAGAHV